MSTPFFFTLITIGLAQGNVQGCIIFADNSPLMRLANFSLNWMANLRTRCASPRAAGGKALPFPTNRCCLFQVIFHSLSISSGVFPSGSGICISFNPIVSEEGSNSGIIAQPRVMSSAHRSPLSNVHTCLSSHGDSLATDSSSSTAIAPGGSSLRPLRT